MGCLGRAELELDPMSQASLRANERTSSLRPCPSRRPHTASEALLTSLSAYFFQRISYNTRYFSGNYGVVIAVLGVYALCVPPPSPVLRPHASA